MNRSLPAARLLTRLAAKAKRTLSVKLLHGVSLTLICIALVVAIAFALVIPELTEGANNVVDSAIQAATSPVCGFVHFLCVLKSCWKSLGGTP